MSGDIKAKIGTKLSETEQKALDPKKVGKMQGKHPKADVEAQYTSLQVCPYCSCVGYGQKVRPSTCTSLATAAAGSSRPDISCSAVISIPLVQKIRHVNPPSAAFKGNDFVRAS